MYMESSVLSRLFLGGAAPPYCANVPPISVSEAAAPPLRMMACKAMYSIIITKQLYTCKYTALVCSTIVTNSQIMFHYEPV